jgi:hypothetical protein
MAEKRYYIGDHGPYFYDDADAIDDPDVVFPGETRQTIRSEGQMRLDTIPTDAEEIVRLEDLGTINGQFVLGLETATAGLRRFPAARQMTNDEDRFRYHFMMGC